VLPTVPVPPSVPPEFTVAHQNCSVTSPEMAAGATDAYDVMFSSSRPLKKSADWRRLSPARTGSGAGAVAFASFTLRLSKNAIRYLFGAPCS
jgi:hypothetical protein